MPNGAPPSPALEAYKLEYQLAAARYESIYKAIWQIFSYLAAVTGAILTFGGDHFQQNLLWVITSAPLLFWYLSTYRPMDAYGNHCLDRLGGDGGIEDQINRLAGSDIRHYKNFGTKNKSGKGPHVRTAVNFFFGVLLVIAAYNGYRTVRAWLNHEPLILKKSADTKTISLTADDLKKLLQQSAPSSTQTPPEAMPAAHDAKKD